MYTYANKETVNNILNSHKNKTIDELITVVKDYHQKLKKNLEERKKCTSDFCYWGLLAVGEEYEMILEALEKEIYDAKIKELKDICPSVFKVNYKEKYDASNEKYQKVIAKSEAIKKDLLIYKPHSYKNKIELIDMIFKEET